MYAILNRLEVNIIKGKKGVSGQKASRKKILTASILFFIGFLIAAYPIVSNWWNQKVNSELIKTYDSKISEIDESKIEKMRAAAEAYNRKHTANQLETDTLDNGKQKLPKSYMSLLNPLRSGIMGSIDIPKIGVRLTIYHGVGKDVLMKGAGHVYGTSLPVAGKSSHTVIAAHRGLPNAKMFTNIDRLKKGDKIYLDVLEKTYAYEVRSSKVVKPDDTRPFKIVDGQELLSLVTCTPYGVNTHRLIVRAVRVPYKEPRDSKVTDIPPREIDDILRWLCAFICLIAAVLFVWMLKKDSKRSKPKKASKKTPTSQNNNDGRSETVARAGAKAATEKKDV